MDIYFKNDFIKNNEIVFYAIIVSIIVMVIMCFVFAVMVLKKK